ncbi:hypothetical protein GCM10022240_13840 [Microbacterium kribbense]|uniref:DNA polymerase III subunit gamma/tau n=1 Tax=Microbacterium kribbense TaxID=433645 RepID=A0ABP7GHM8_9MICO
MAADPNPPDEDAALRWEGDEQSRPVLPAGWAAKGKGAETVATADSAVDPTHAIAAADLAEADPEPMGNATLIGLGMLGGVYLLFVIGWIIGGFRLQGKSQSLVTDAMFQGSFWLAVLAPIIWFGTVFLLTRGKAAWLRIVWLVAGFILLVPWPFIMTGAVGA